MNQSNSAGTHIPVMMSVELFDAPEMKTRLFYDALREFKWANTRDQPRLFWNSLPWQRECDAEVLAACKHHLALAASSAGIVDFDGMVVLGFPEPNGPDSTS